MAALIQAPGETLADALTDLTRIANAHDLGNRDGCGVLVIRRVDGSVVAALADDETPFGEIRDEVL
jgi:hypothetical protein